jgi:hypothetical protein
MARRICIALSKNTKVQRLRAPYSSTRCNLREIMGNAAEIKGACLRDRSIQVKVVSSRQYELGTRLR